MSERIFYLYTLTPSTEADFHGGRVLKVNLKFTGKSDIRTIYKEVYEFQKMCQNNNYKQISKRNW